MNSKAMPHPSNRRPRAITQGLAFLPGLPLATTPQKTTLSESTTELHHARKRTPVRRTASVIRAVVNEPPQLSQEAVVAWLKSSSGKLADQVDLSATHPRTRLGVRVNKDVLKGTELAAIPDNLCLTPRQARAFLDRDRPAAARDALAALSDEAAMATALLQHRADPASALAPLVDALPTAIDAAPVWSDAQRALLVGSPVHARANEVRAGVRAEFADVVAALAAGGAGCPDWLTEDAFCWAAAVVDARAAPASQAEPLVLSAVIAATRIERPGGAPGAELRVEGGLFSRRRFALVAARDLAEGEEVTLGADGRDSTLVLERGVAFGGDEGAEAELSFEVSSLDRFFEDKEEILERMEVPVAPTFQLRPADASGKWTPPENMDAFLRLLCLTGMDAFLLEGVFRGEVWAHMELPVSAENEQAVCDLVIGAVEDALDQYDAGDDGKALERPDEGDEDAVRTWLARTVTQGERSVLQAAADHYRRQLQSLDALEYYAERRLNALDLLRPVDECEIVDSESGARAGRAFDENYY